MYNELKELIKNAKTKVYKFPVAAIVECIDGSIYKGVNIETSSPASGICAERNALYQAIADGKNKEDFKRIYILNETEKNITPCFICRQALYDFCNSNIEIISYNNSGLEQKFILNELCPYPFSEDDLI